MLANLSLTEFTGSSKETWCPAKSALSDSDSNILETVEKADFVDFFEKMIAQHWLGLKDYEINRPTLYDIRS